jgi:hypothetical protein
MVRKTYSIDGASKPQEAPMSENLAMLRSRRPFQLPTTTMSISYKDAGKCVAHSMDFDLVCVADTEEEASKNLRLAMKTYIEFGLSHQWADEIYFPAPQEFQDRITEKTPVRVGPTILIDDRSMRLIEAEIPEAVAA